MNDQNEDIELLEQLIIAMERPASLWRMELAIGKNENKTNLEVAERLTDVLKFLQRLNHRLTWMENAHDRLAEACTRNHDFLMGVASCDNCKYWISETTEHWIQGASVKCPSGACRVHKKVTAPKYKCAYFTPDLDEMKKRHEAASEE